MRDERHEGRFARIEVTTDSFLSKVVLPPSPEASIAVDRQGVLISCCQLSRVVDREEILGSWVVWLRIAKLSTVPFAPTPTC